MGASAWLRSSSRVLCAGGSPQSEEEEEAAALSQGSGVCKWFNMRMGFGFISMSSRDGAPLDQNLDVFVHQVRLGWRLEPSGRGASRERWTALLRFPDPSLTAPGALTSAGS